MSKVDIDELVRWRNQCEALTASLQRKVRHCDEITEERDKAQRERDEARAEAERWKASLKAFRKDYWAEGNRWLEKAHARAEEAETELNRLRSFAKPWEGDAYRRGAEAMREACARWMSEREGISQWVYDDALSALPIPEDK